MNRVFYCLVAFLCFTNSEGFAQSGYDFQDKFIIVLDIQEVFIQQQLTDSVTENLILNINKIISKANPEKVIYIKSIMTQLSISFKGIKVDTIAGLNLDERLNMVNGNIYEKSKANAFSSKGMMEFIEKNETHDFIVVGLMAEHCVYQTLLGGIENGFKMATIPEAVAGKSTSSKSKKMKKLQKKGVGIIEIM